MKDNDLKPRVKRMIDRLEREDVCMHGFTLSVGGQAKAEAYYAPFEEGQPHRMYSVSKTLTGIAIGMLMGEGKLNMTDHIADYFTDYLPAAPDERLMRLKLSDMLRMATCHRSTAYREGVDENWTKPFFNVTPTHEPGSVFYYDTGCSQVLAALVKRLSGKEVIDYLNERLFARIGATDQKYWLRDPSGACQGGTGLCMSLRDLNKTALAVMRGGDGVIPAWYCAEMGKRHIATPLQAYAEEVYGYGLQCWRTRAGYAMYGLGGQLAVICPEKEALFCTIADTRLDPVGVNRIYDAFFEEVYPYIGISDMEFTRWDLRVTALKSISGCAVQRAGEYYFSENQLGLRALSLEGNVLKIVNRQGESALKFGIGENIGQAFPGFPSVPAICSGGYVGDGQLRVRCFAIGDSPCGFDMLLCFQGSRVTVQARRSSDPMTAGFEGVASGYLRA